MPKLVAAPQHITSIKMRRSASILVSDLLQADQVSPMARLMPLLSITSLASGPRPQQRNLAQRTCK